MTFLPFLPGNDAGIPQVINEMSGLYRPTATDADLDRLYSTGTAIYTAANYRSENLALCKWLVKDENGKALDPSHPLSLVMKTDLPEIIQRSEIALCFRGRNLIYKVRNIVTMEVTRLQWINFNMYQLDKDWRRGLIGFRVFGYSSNHQPVEVDYISQDDAIYMHLIDLRDDFDGVSPAEVAFMNAGIDVETASTQLAFFQNMAIPALLIQPAADSRSAPTDKEVKNFTDLLRRIAKGVANVGRNVVTPHRYDVKELQPRFVDLAMEELSTQARQAVYSALRVPMELIMPSASNFAQAYESRRAWLQTWLQPKAWWYASHFTEQLVKPIDPRWHIEPDFTDVPGIKEDAARQTEIVNLQVSGGYLDLATAQAELGRTVDERLRGIYNFPGFGAVPIAQFDKVLQSKMAAPQMGGGMFGGMPAMQSQGSVTPESLSSPRPMKTIDVLPDPVPDWLPDDVFKELRDWRRIVERKGVDYAFEARELPVDTVDFGRRLLGSGYNVDETFRAMKAHYFAGRISVADKEFDPSQPRADDAPQSFKSLTDADAQDYWRDFDALREQVGETWCGDYQRRVWEALAPRVRSDLSDTEVLAAMNDLEGTLVNEWIGTADAPGPLFALYLAGMQAGEVSLERNRTANPEKPVAQKAIGIMPIDWKLVPAQALDYVKDYSFNLIRGLNETTRENVRSALSGWLASGDAREALDKQLQAVFLDPVRAQSIAQTESTRAYNAGAFRRWQDAGVKQAKWVTVHQGEPHPVCDICKRLDGQVADIAVGWKDPLTGIVYREVAHVNDRCMRRPIL